MLNETENSISEKSALRVIASADFIVEVLESTQPVLVEFCTAWSRPCQALEPVLQKLAADCAGKVKVVCVNADDSLDLSLVYDIQDVPTLMCFVEGNPRWRVIGTATADAIEAKLQPFLN
jgi:thioredoxin 1